MASSKIETSAHTCYVEVWPHYQRIFAKGPDPVEVCNDQGAAARMFQLLRENPQALVKTETVQPERLTKEPAASHWVWNPRGQAGLPKL